MKKLKLFLLILLAAFVLSPFFLSAHEDIMGKPHPMLEFSNTVPGTQTFLSGSPTWYRPPGVEYVLAIVVAGGAGGQDGSGASGAGGMGGDCKTEIVDVRGTISETITVGAGGAKEANGSASSFGTLVTAVGGTAGVSGLIAIIPLKTNRGQGSGGVGGASARDGAGGAYGEGGDYGGDPQTGGGGGGSFGKGGTGGPEDTDDGFAAAANTGGGGGGGSDTGTGGAGGSGIVKIIPLISDYSALASLKYKLFRFVSWLNPFSTPVAVAGGPIIYAEIADGNIRAFHTRTDGKVPGFTSESGITVIKVTGLDPMPKQRWKHNSETGEFSLPDPPDPQVAIDNKIRNEMFSAASRAAAIVRLISTDDLAANYTE